MKYYYLSSHFIVAIWFGGEGFLRTLCSVFYLTWLIICCKFCVGSWVWSGFWPLCIVLLVFFSDTLVSQKARRDLHSFSLSCLVLITRAFWGWSNCSKLHVQSGLHRWLQWGSHTEQEHFSFFSGKCSLLLTWPFEFWSLGLRPSKILLNSLCKTKRQLISKPCDQFKKLNPKLSNWIRNGPPSSSFIPITVSFTQGRNGLLVPSPPMKILSYL